MIANIIELARTAAAWQAMWAAWEDLKTAINAANAWRNEDTCLAHLLPEPCKTCRSYIAAGL